MTDRQRPFPVTAAALGRMMAQFTNAPISTVGRMGSSVANDVFAVELADGARMALRVLRNQTPAGVRREIELQRALRDADLQTPLILPLASGSMVGYEGEYAFTVAEYHPGRSWCEMTAELARDFGRTLARFHRATSDVELDHHDWLSPFFVDEELGKLSPNDRTRFDDLLDGTQELFTSGLPEANIHGDLYLGNVHVADNRITTIFDLEAAEHIIRLADIAQSGTNVAIAAGIDPIPAGDLVLDGYAEHTPVTSEERAALPTALRYSAATQALWLHNRGFPHAETYVALAEAVRGGQVTKPVPGPGL